MYAKDRAEYLAAHPFCQIFMARNRINERDVLDLYSGWDSSMGYIPYRGFRIPFANQIHHRNKAHGERLLDKRWWMACCREEHEWVENHKSEARRMTLLLPIQADKEGNWGAGQQALTTPELLNSLSR